MKLQTELSNKQIELKEKDLALKDKQVEFIEKEKELVKLSQELANVKKEIVTAESVIKVGKSIEIVQAPMVVAAGFNERMVKYIFTSLVISLVVGILLAFVLYDIKNRND